MVTESDKTKVFHELRGDMVGVISRLADWIVSSDSQMRLSGGEMTAQEIRTVRAVLSNIAGGAGRKDRRERARRKIS